MKKRLIFLLTLSVAVLFIVQPVSAWAAPNHYDIVEEVYYSLPNDAQERLDLSQMINGADDPDFKFFDFQYHSFPASKEKANEWLERGQDYYSNGNYEQASYCFGVATHYLSDSVCPPHSEGGHPGYEHTNFEVQAIFLHSTITDNKGNTDITVWNCNQISENSWDNWIKTGDTTYIQQCLDDSADLSYINVKNAL